MPIQHIQTSFATGEWAPALYARVDQAKYHSAAALLSNFFVDYRGGASSRMGTKYILQARVSNKPVRLIRFQASFAVNYIIEMGDFYFRFYNNGSPVLETATTITAQTPGSPVVFTDNAHGYVNGDWLFAGNKYYIVANATTNTFTLTDLFGNAINTNPFTLPASAQRVYTLASPYAAEDLATLKFAQNVNTLLFTQENYGPFVLTLITAANWTILPVAFGSSIAAPAGGAVATTLAAGAVNYGYVITSVDANGQESAPTAPIFLTLRTDLRTVAGTNTVSWTARTGAASYNIYKASPTYNVAGVPLGSQYGFIGNVTGTSIADSNISPDFSQTPPIAQNPFQGAGVLSVAVTAPGLYTSVPTVTIADPPSGGATATAVAVLQLLTAIISLQSGASFVGDTYIGPAGLYGSPQLRVTGITGPGTITSIAIINPGAITAGSAPSVIQFLSTFSGNFINVNVTWGVGLVNMVNNGAGYLTAPAVTFSSGAAAATATLGMASAGNPTVPGYFGQRLFLAAPVSSPQTFNFSKVGAGSYYNFDISNPIQEDDAISGTLSSQLLNTIKAAVPMPSGLVVLCDSAAWLLNSGTTKSGVDPINIDASPQSYNGCNDMPPIVVNFDIIYVDSKNSIVRDLAYNFYTNVFTGTDITILSSHLFFGYNLLEWAYCEEPFKLTWVVRDDGVALCLTFMKEQELIGWTHSDTEGLFKSVASCIEPVSFGYVDVPYFVVERIINGSTVKYIERMAERYFPNGMVDAWCVDAGLQYRGVPATSFTGGEHLAGATIVGLADGLPITPFVMPTNGNFTLPTAASVVTVGLAYTPELQTLPIDLGAPTIQGEEKKITGVTVRVAQTLGLEIGGDANTLVPMDDLILGNVGKDTNVVVTDLVTGDALQTINSAWTVPGQYLIRQPQPLPASILGVIPQITVGSRKA